jgi:hypothetical protein
LLARSHPWDHGCDSVRGLQSFLSRKRGNAPLGVAGVLLVISPVLPGVRPIGGNQWGSHGWLHPLFLPFTPLAGQTVCLSRDLTFCPISEGWGDRGLDECVQFSLRKW